MLQGQGVSAVHGLWLAKMINIGALVITYIIPYYKYIIIKAPIFRLNIRTEDFSVWS